MFRELRYVYEVYRQQSFSKAAKVLYISQPSLSAMIKKAERRIGSPIFDRSTLPISLTEAGKAYIRASEQIMGIEQDLTELLNDMEHCLTGTLSLGGTTMFTSYVLPPLISRFSATYPGVEVRLNETHTVNLKRSLLDGALDLAIDNWEFEPEGFSSFLYLNERVLLAVPAQLPINSRLPAYRLDPRLLASGGALDAAPAVPLRSFQEENFLLLKEGNDTRTRADRLCAESGFRPRIRLQMDQQIAAYNFALYGMGVAFISETLARSAPQDGRLCFYRLGSETAKRSIRFFYKSNRPLTQPMKAFLRCGGLLG